jgi:hypothetical protein
MLGVYEPTALSHELAYVSIARPVWIERRKAGPSYKPVS